MQAITLVDKAHPETVIGWACGVCGRTFRCPDLAERCCALVRCTCGNECERYYTACRECIQKADRAKLQEMVQKAEKLDASMYSGPVYCEETEEYYPTAYDAFEDLADDLDLSMLPERREKAVLWACHTDTLKLRADMILDHCLEAGDYDEDARDQITQEGYQELEEMTARWNEAHGSEVERWEMDRTRQVVIPPEWWEEFDASVKAEVDAMDGEGPEYSGD